MKQFIQVLHENIFTGIAYSRIKQKLNGLSPVQFRK
ncbi:hypothetical protein ACJQ47_002101 [Enterococcus faecalis]